MNEEHNLDRVNYNDMYNVKIAMIVKANGHINLEINYLSIYL
jgi:hypothetical protein